ncbi:MAG TPA: [protein-PII] uridylyltransferase [Gammaproteobacteria bacterium]|nr:[protein-PII] uridylyltransferase [Gammaproteobacteria bacterium]
MTSTSKFCDQWLTSVESLEVNPKNFRNSLSEVQAELDVWFDENRPIRTLIETLTHATDKLIQLAWAHYLPANEGCALLAVGGYGREALHPGSDIDILVLLEPDAEDQWGEKIGEFFTFLWDMRLDLGNSVRSIESCVDEGARDLTIATTYFESRLLAGSENLYDQFETAINAPDFWPSHDFFKAKLKEQQQRHSRFGDTAYRIEPNLKESPGGLRDTQIISWIVARHFGVQTLEDLIGVDFLTEEEFEILNSARDFLWRLRFCLHRLVGRKEDRLLLQHQKTAAAAFGYNDTTGNLAVEQFMKQYFRGATEIQRLNEMLLQLFEEQITLKNILSQPVELNERFQSRSGYLEIKNPAVIENYPPALLELFLLLQQNPNLVGVRATTIRAVRSHLHLIDDGFRNDPRCQQLFMQILGQPTGVYHEFKRMSTYGVLAAYLPEFGAVVGLMQFDLYHAYTVDEHTIMVMRYARRLSVKKYADEIPRCSKIFAALRDPVLLYIACLYHDIAKGRGGNHSELGVVDATRFCERHGLGETDTQLICWLVSEHLTMSTVSQRKDISDPDVIHEFLGNVKTVERLNYLYLLTVSDMQGTSKEVWSDWKSSLLARLHRASLDALQAADAELTGAENLLETSSQALETLLQKGNQEQTILDLWETLDTEYFQKQDPESIVWQTEKMLTIESSDSVVVSIREATKRGATGILTYTADHSNFFWKVSNEIARLGLNIMAAEIFTTRAGMALQIFYVLDQEGNPCREKTDLQRMTEQLRAAILNSSAVDAAQFKFGSRQLKSFDTPADIKFTNSENKEFTELQISAADRPGLLVDIVRILAEENINIRHAFIATVSERAEDVLHIETETAKQLDDSHQHTLRKKLLETLAS